MTSHSSARIGAIIAIALSAVACDGARAATIKAANGLAGSAEVAELLLTSICRTAELRAIQDSATDDEAGRRTGAIAARCAVAWDAYAKFRADWLELALAVQAERGDRDSPEVDELLRRATEDEQRFVALVGDIARELGRGDS